MCVVSVVALSSNPCHPNLLMNSVVSNSNVAVGQVLLCTASITHHYHHSFFNLAGTKTLPAATSLSKDVSTDQDQLAADRDCELGGAEGQDGECVGHTAVVVVVCGAPIPFVLDSGSTCQVLSY